MMVSVSELYDLWAGESQLDAELGRSLEPRGTEWLFELFASLGPRPGQLVLDIGARDAGHAIRLVRDHDLRAIAIDPLSQHVERARAAVAEAAVEVDVREGAIEDLPLPDASVDWIWCRDVLVHTDVSRGLAECARVLVPGGQMLAYVTLATELLEPREAAALADGLALVPESLDGRVLERAADDAALVLVAVHRLGGEWRERMLEDRDWDVSDALLRLSRLRRSEPELVRAFGPAAVEAYRAGHLWGIYQLLGKLCPTIYVLERPRG